MTNFRVHDIFVVFPTCRRFTKGSEYQNTFIDRNSRQIPSNGRPSFEQNWNKNFISTGEVLQIELCRPALLTAAHVFQFNLFLCAIFHILHYA